MYGTASCEINVSFDTDERDTLIGTRHTVDWNRFRFAIRASGPTAIAIHASFCNRPHVCKVFPTLDKKSGKRFCDDRSRLVRGLDVLWKNKLPPPALFTYPCLRPYFQKRFVERREIRFGNHFRTSKRIGKTYFNVPPKRPGRSDRAVKNRTNGQTSF